MKRIEELDFTRIIAMIAVITIHVTSAYIGYQSNILVMGMNVAFILNQLSKHSMTIYFMHVLVLRIFRHFSIFERGMSGMLFLLAAVFACSLFVAIFLDNIIWKVKANKTTH